MQQQQQLDVGEPVNVADGLLKDTAVGVSNVVLKESPGAVPPDPLPDSSVVTGRMIAQKIRSKKKKQRWRNNIKIRKSLDGDSSDVVSLFLIIFHQFFCPTILWNYHFP
jgi:hypothetical protein